MCQLANPENNYGIYRNALKNAAVPLLPYLACFMRDLTYLEELPNTVKNEDGLALVNWVKMRQLGGIFQFLLKAQEFPYSIEPDTTLQPLLRRVEVVDEKLAYQISKELEPTSFIEATLKKKNADVRKKVDTTQCAHCSAGMAIAAATWKGRDVVGASLEEVSDIAFPPRVNLHYWLRKAEEEEEDASEAAVWTSVRRWELDADVQAYIDLEKDVDGKKAEVAAQELRNRRLQEEQCQIQRDLLRCSEDVERLMVLAKSVAGVSQAASPDLLAFLGSSVRAAMERLEEAKERLDANRLMMVRSSDSSNLKSSNSAPNVLGMSRSGSTVCSPLSQSSLLAVSEAEGLSL